MRFPLLNVFVDFWVTMLTIIGSILLYPAGGMRYIDTLFFASGACTQSGLNTVDVNTITTYQQVILFFLPMFTNPISINTFVVFLRLYWFEKRFQHIAREAKTNRRSVSKSRSQMRPDRDIDRVERGVNGRHISVLHDTTRPNGMTNDGMLSEGMRGEKAVGPDEQPISSSESEPSNEGASTNSEKPEETAHPQGITFADRVKRSDGLDDEELRRPTQRSEADHIAFLERQRNPEDKGVLRIPGPRDADAGVAPETVEEDDEIRRTTSRRASTFDGRRASQTEDPHATTGGERIRQRNITIQEPDHVRVTERVDEDARAAAHTLGALRIRMPRRLHGGQHPEETMPTTKSRAKSFASFKTAISRGHGEADVMPYLSWQPTVGRNSAFVDLTEEQREELGGIEYRSLKSLAAILVLYFLGFTIFGIVSLTPWILHSSYGPILNQVGQSKTWWGIFTTTSAFNDVGFTLTPTSMIPFQTAVWPLLLCSFLIIIGNTGFPIMLRFIIWVTSLYVPKGSGIWEELKFLLDHPRRCFTLLFPGRATWWLFWILVGLNGIDLVLFIILDVIHPPFVMKRPANRHVA